ncbi:LmbE family N-acetylglucosaminyl deacetylase [Mesoflavibacter sabulilitoris]|uniref:LmbE family protein n=1 Tax=Mesoflavibacter zeaxanthinifaciens subsp. sabulilitoris TaxID=1520893 RepID=A0A2T1NFH2_9FLAO|nr:PIG-L family deacetylase [Mesoflavibacter zeaxanthinifaciens]MBB3124721.1 LmbE family N-acetylglucosaminyl deacetylase [Mesoflavibacter zeaxanthinifaciens subsp. sabulilitoris]PSG91183.1 LmbE family protein [Mesoflavibacter zeaxanthinifaciens subsp. sabulilitoris]
MLKKLASLLFIFVLALPLQAQQPKKLNASQIHDAVKKLNFLGTVLYVAAHPDDENTRLISYMSNQIKARTAYLSLTRGDGGQNLIGPEIRELLGVIRTQELLAARSVDGGEQRFSRANDFGYSKHPEETLDIWNKDQVLSDVVLAIRQFKPDIIINRFDHRTPGTTHGHHTTSAMLSVEAFDLTNNPNIYPEQAKTYGTWQPKRQFFNTSWWFYGSQENFEKADKSKLLNFDIGVYYPSKGLSNNEIAALSRSKHLCQGFGALTQRGSQTEYIELINGDLPKDKTNLFEGIDTSWNRVKGGKTIGDILKKVETNFNFENPSIHVKDLLLARQLIQQLDNDYWKNYKTQEIDAIIEACLGLYLEASASTPTASAGETITLNIEAVNRSPINMELVSYQLSTDKTATLKALPLKNNDKQNVEQSLTIPKNIQPSSPYWLNKKGTLGMYKVEDKNLIGKPETPRPISVTFNVTINNQPFSVTKPIVYRYSKPDKGELYRPFEIIPEASAKISEKVIIFDSDQQKDISVIVKAGRDNLNGFVQIAHPNNWSVFPEKQNIDIKYKGETQTLTFTVIPPKNQNEGLITPMVHVGEDVYTRELVEIDYEHIPYQTVVLPSESKVVRLDIKKRGENIAYIEGAGDVVPESLRQIGYNVIVLNPEDITTERLSAFDAVVVGIRAYNILDELKFKQQILFDFVENGGNMIVQYNTSHRLKVDQLSPYTLQLSRDRVTDENAEVTLLEKDHPVLNYPNQITKTDFEGWTQERGLYFPNQWSNKFTPILSMHDKGETEKQGSLLVAKHGKGYYIYTGLSFFREFPAGVSGAYRLFANMLSIGKDNLDNKEQFKD